MKTVTRVFLVRNDGRFLVLTRTDRDDKTGRRISAVIPGGKQDNFELPVQAASREVAEEVGVYIHPTDLVFVYQEVDFQRQRQMRFYLAFNWQGEPYLREPHKFKNMYWLSPDEYDDFIRQQHCRAGLYVEQALYAARKEFYLGVPT